MCRELFALRSCLRMPIRWEDMDRVNDWVGRSGHRGRAAMTLVEVVVGMAVSAIAVGCVVSGYLFAVTSAERSAYSMTSSALAMRRLEQARAARWDVAASPVVDELVSSNFPVEIAILDLPRSGSNVVYATNFTRIFTVSTNPPIKGIQVDCVWRFTSQRPLTNSVVTYRRPD